MSIPTIKFRPFYAQKRLNWAIFAILSITLGMFCLLVKSQASAQSLVPGVTGANTIHYKIAHTTVSTASQPVAQSVYSPAAQSVLSICTPDTTYFQPEPLNLDNSPIGLNQVIDSPSNYTVYGNSSSQILSQIQHCAPSFGLVGGENQQFAAETSYNLSWKYSWTSNASGQCVVSSSKVGLHINMVLPRWRATAAADPGLTKEWQSFIDGLTTHENGHVAIDQQYASLLLSDLQNYPATDCSTIEAAIQAKLHADINTLETANDAYDASTNHGMTQGAILN